MIYNDLDQFLNKDSISNPVQINSGNVDSIVESGALPSTSIEGGVTKTYSSSSAPTSGMNIGDMWYDTDDNNKTYRWDGASWVNMQDGDVGQALQDAADAIEAAAAAQGTADGKVTTFYNDEPPTAEGVGDLWIDTNDGNKLYRWSGSVWVEIQDSAISYAISAAGTAQATADGKIVTFFQASAPTAGAIGDLWIDTDDNNHLYRWDGTSWVSAKDTTPIVQSLDTRGFTNGLTFSSTGYSNITWTSGTLTFANGDTYSISSGSNNNTSTNPVYIYLNTDVSTTVLQVTTTASSAVGANKCLVCVKKTNSDSSKKAIFQVMGGADSGVFITADNIAANTITANEIAANTITTNNLTATAIDGMIITGSTIQTTGTTYPSTGVRITTGGDLRLWGNNAYFYPSSGSSYVGYIGGTSGQFYITSTSGVEFKIGSYGDILLDAPSSYGIRPVRITNNLGSSSYWWNNIYGQYFSFYNTGQYLYYSSSSIQSSSNFRVNGSISLTGNMTFENYASFTIKDSGGTSRTLYCQYNSTLGKYILSS